MALLVINADDFGLTDGVCRAIIELFEAGAVSSTTFMAAAIDAPRRAKRWGLQHLRGKVGVHLQLTGGRPLTDSKSVPSLVDNNGMFAPRNNFPKVDPDQAYIEWVRQIELTTELLGVPPTHLDSHHGPHRLPHLHDVYIELAKMYGLPVRSGNYELELKMKEAGVDGPDKTIREWTGRSLGVAAIRELLTAVVQSTPAPKRIELVSHPGYCDDELLRVSSLNRPREDDHIALLNLAATGWLRETGFELVTFASFNVE